MFRLQQLAVGVSVALNLAAGLGVSSVAAQPPTTGTISVAVEAKDQSDAARAAYAAAVADALTARGFTLIDGAGHAALVAQVRLSRSDVGITSAKVTPPHAGVGAGGVLGVGGRLSLPLPTSKTREVPLQQTRLDIRITRRGDEGVLWQGAAITVRAAEAAAGQDGTVARALSDALLRTYPAQPEDVVSVP